LQWISKSLIIKLYGLLSIAECAHANSDYRKAYQDLKFSTLNPKHVITDEDSLKILRIYELLDPNDQTISEPIRNVVKDRFL